VDICAALDLSNATKALNGLDDDETNILKSLKDKKINLRDSPKYYIVSLPSVIRLVWKARKGSFWQSHKPKSPRPLYPLISKAMRSEP
jgi:prophage antirepressor-like protein